MNPAEIVVAEEQGQHVLVILDLLGERVGQAGEPAIAHADRQVVALDVAG